jgi:hypothetical protein
MLLIMLASFACCDSAYQIVADVLVVQPFLLASSSTSPNSQQQRAPMELPLHIGGESTIARPL